VRPGRVRSGLLSLLVATTVAGLALAACGSGTSTNSGSTRPTTSGPSDPTAGALTAYRGMWSDLVTAARTSDYQSALLPDHTTGDALTLFVQGLARDQLHDIVTRGNVVLHPSVSSLSPAAHPIRATVTDCVDDSGWVEYTTAGRRAHNPKGGRRATTAMLTSDGGTWKVDQLKLGAVGSC
jgi:hypothetical protein